MRGYLSGKYRADYFAPGIEYLEVFDDGPDDFTVVKQPNGTVGEWPRQWVREFIQTGVWRPLGMYELEAVLRAKGVLA